VILSQRSSASSQQETVLVKSFTSSHVHT